MYIYELLRAKPSSGTGHRGWLMDYMNQKNDEKANSTDSHHHHEVPMNVIAVTEKFVAHACATDTNGQLCDQHRRDNDGVEIDELSDEFSQQQIDGDGGIKDNISNGFISQNGADEPVKEKNGVSFRKTQKTVTRKKREVCVRQAISCMYI